MTACEQITVRAVMVDCFGDTVYVYTEFDVVRFFLAVSIYLRN